MDIVDIVKNVDLNHYRERIRVPFNYASGLAPVAFCYPEPDGTLVVEVGVYKVQFGDAIGGNDSDLNAQFYGNSLLIMDPISNTVDGILANTAVASMTVDWGDGNSTFCTIVDMPEPFYHTYISEGDYTITMYVGMNSSLYTSSPVGYPIITGQPSTTVLFKARQPQA